jgi:hypothetical protein
LKRFLQLWVCLAFGLTVATVAVSVLAFRRLDLRYQTFLELLFIPTFQAAIVGWLTAAFGPARVLRAIRETVSHRLVVVVLAVDAAFLVAGWLVRAEPFIGIVGAATLHVRWAGLKALAAAALTLAAVPRRDTRGAQTWLCLGAASLLVLGSNAFAPWLRGLETLVPARFPTVLNWIMVYGAVFVFAVVVALGSGGVLTRRSGLAGFYVDAAVATVCCVALLVVASFFLHPYLVEPWASLVRTGLSLAATFMLVASGLGWSAATPPASAEAEVQS